MVERALAKVPGVTFATVNLATESAFVIANEGVTFEMMEETVKKTGYGIVKDAPADFDEINYRVAKHNLIFILVIGIPLTVLMYMRMIWGIKVPYYTELEILIGGVGIFYGARKTLRGAWIALSHGHTNMDTLIALSASASWLTAVAVEFGADIPSFGTVGVMILMMHIIGRFIESRLRDRAAKQVKALLKLQPREARLIEDGKDIMVPIEAVKPDSIVQVNPGERIPLDGVVEEGISEIDESLLTGESIPVVKREGDEVTGGAMNLSGLILVKTTKVGEDTFLSKMLNLVREAQGSKVPLQALADRITFVFVPAVFSFAVISAVMWFVGYSSLLNFTEPIAKHLPWTSKFISPAAAAIYSFVATLVIACPCALGLATPMALVTSTGEASRNGLLIRNAEAIQTLHEADLAVLDKTGTLTRGEPKPVYHELPDEAKPYVYALEANSGHPLAKAVIDLLGECDYTKPDTLTEKSGEGIMGTWGETEWFVGRPLNRAKWQGKVSAASTVIEVRKNGEPVGFFSVFDGLRDDSMQAVADLKELGITPLMATGDGKDAALEIAKAAGITDVRWEVRPEDKLSIVQEEQAKGHKVIMAGDGINDAAALKGAHVGIAMGGGMDLAVDSSDIVILKGGLSKVVAAARISAVTWRVIRQNLAWAFFYNIIAIPLAMLGLLHPIVAETAMAISSVTVVANSMRIAGSGEKKH